MPMMDMLKDPATGKVKPAVLIGGAGIGIAGIFMLLNKGGGGVTSPGQSGANTDALNGLGSAILGLAGGSGGGGGATQTPATNTGGGGSGSGLVPVKQGTTGGSSTIATGVVPKTTAISKPSNSGLSPAPRVVTHTPAPVVPKPTTATPGYTPVVNAITGFVTGVTKLPAPAKHPTVTNSRTSNTNKVATRNTSNRQQDPTVPAKAATKPAPMTAAVASSGNKER